MKLAWGCLLVLPISSPNTPPTTSSLFFQYTIHFSFIRPTIFTLGMTLRMSPPRKQSVNRTALLSTFTLPLWKELACSVLFLVPFFYGLEHAYGSKVRNEQMKMLIAFYGTLKLKGEINLGDDTLVRIIHPYGPLTNSHSWTYGPYILRNSILPCLTIAFPGLIVSTA